MENKMVTILTPTYNRAYCLDKLYHSLCDQTKNDFNWLIVDDGSMDNTKEVVDNFIRENKVEINYIYKENGGKHTALNRGIKKVTSKYVFIVDSDDVITNDAIEKIIKYDEKYGNVKDICGYSFLRKYPDGKINGKLFEKDELIDTYLNVRIFGNDFTADKAEVFFTNVLKEYPFPEFEKEKFLGEDIVWVELSKKYKMVHINTAIYQGDYQNDGLTKNRRKNNIKSCKGCYERSKQFLSVRLPLKVKVKNILQLYVYGKFSNYSYKKIKKDCNHKLLLSIFHFCGYCLYKKWNRDVLENVGGNI